MVRKKTNKDRMMEHPVTYEAYAEMPDDGQRYEVLDGELELMSPAPSTVHQAIGSSLHLLVQSCSSDYFIRRRTSCPASRSRSASCLRTNWSGGCWS
ncbi:hypothetical protein [Cohnella hongkongensis]|uniref:Restriction endonuclease domain-containing protein n=1 Tax=Cohnella hongkongensis TaxID=178337 RepID=A0ABV9F8Y9_9BACL